MAMGSALQLERQRASASVARLEALSPLAVMRRGYSVTQAADGKVVRDAATLKTDDEIVTTLAQGRVRSVVDQVEAEETET